MGQTYHTGCKNEKDIAIAVEHLLSRMTLEEKIGQMSQTVGQDITYIGSTKTEYKMEDLVAEGRVGSMIQVAEPEKLVEICRKFQDIAVNKTRLGIPLLFCQDVIHGFETVFPIPLAWACSFDMEKIGDAAKTAAREATTSGINCIFAPMVDVVHDARWGRVAESGGEDPYLSGEIAKAIVKGFQGEKLGEEDTSAAACLKHYLGYGAAEGGRDYNTTEFSRTGLYNTYLPPFRAGVQAGAGMVMTAFNVIEGIPAVANKWLVNDVLRGELGFDGVVVSDYNAVMELLEHGVATDEEEAARKACEATLDIEMTTSLFWEHLPKLIEDGVVDEKLVDEAVTRVLTLKYKLGLMDNPYRHMRAKEIKEKVFCKEHREQSKRLAQDSAVLLKNDGVLPFSRDNTVAVIGPFADSTDLNGCWAFSFHRKETVTLAEGLKAQGVKTLVAKGCEAENEIENGIDEAVAVARQADVVVLALGETDRMSGEACSRMQPVLPKCQDALAKAVCALGKPTVVCLFNGRPLVVNWYAENCNAVLECWQLGTETGDAVAALLLGDINPSGKLSMCFPRDIGQIPLYYNYLPTGRPTNEESGEHFQSRYLDGSATPLYPFGYGLSYTSFELSDIRLDKVRMRTSGSAKLTVTLKNTGKCAGSEVVQLYIRDVAASISRPVRELKGFKKLKLQPGESCEVCFEINEDMLSYYMPSGEKVLEEGKFLLMVSTYATNPNTLVKELEVYANK